MSPGSAHTLGLQLVHPLQTGRRGLLLSRAPGASLIRSLWVPSRTPETLSHNVYYEINLTILPRTCLDQSGLSIAM